MRISQALIIVLLVIGICGCKSVSRARESAALFQEANGVWAQTHETTKEWTVEYVKGFGPEKRAQFPANRAELKVSADKIVKILDEEARVINVAILKYDQAIELISDEQKRKGMSLLVSSMKKDLEISKLIKSQMKLVSDQSIVDGKTFEEKFLGFGREIGRVRSESRAALDEGKRILGM